MNKKEVLEVRKQFTPENCTISRICGCYVDHEKNKKMEYAMLDCIAYSLLDNLDYCNEVYFRSNDEIYESKYIYMNHDEPYISK